MKINILNRLFLMMGAVGLLTGLTGCQDLFTDPTKDKETGETVTLLLVDRNFIKTKFMVKLVDNATGEQLAGENIKVMFTGAGSEKMVEFDGTKATEYATEAGLIEVGIDPNFTISKQTPLEFTIMAMGDHFVGVPQFVSINSVGANYLTLRLIRISSSMKSAGTGFDEPFRLTYGGLVNSPDLTFMTDLRTHSTGTAYKYLNFYMTIAGGLLVCDNLTEPLLYSDYGVYYVDNLYVLAPPSLPEKTVGMGAGAHVYTTVLPTGQLKCEDDLIIDVNGPAGGSAVFDYKLTFSDGTTKTGQLVCDFATNNTVSQIYYPAANPAVKVEVFGDAQYTVSGAVDLTSPCGQTATFTASPRTNLRPFHMVTQYSCADNPLGYALSISGEFRKAGTNDPWTNFTFTEGIADLQLEPGPNYIFRVLLDNKYESVEVPTTEAGVLGLQRVTENYTITYLDYEDLGIGKKINVSLTIQLNQNVCDKLN